MSHLDDQYAPGNPLSCRLKPSSAPKAKPVGVADKERGSGSAGAGDSSASSAVDGPFMCADATADSVGEIFAGLTKSSKEEAGPSKVAGKRRPGGGSLQKKPQKGRQQWALHPGSIRDS
jgi:hypothetical protein